MEERKSFWERETSVASLEQRLRAIAVVPAGNAGLGNGLCCFQTSGKPSPFLGMWIFLKQAFVPAVCSPRCLYQRCKLME